MVLFDIVIPAFNCEKYLKQFLDSIISQTYSNWRAIVVDDGSTDSTPQILDNYALLDKRIIPIHKSNGGECSARNAALVWLKSDSRNSDSWLCFVDSDDFVDYRMCDVLCEIIRNNPNTQFIRSYNTRVSAGTQELRLRGTDDDTDDIEYRSLTKDEYFSKSIPGGYISSIIVQESVVLDRGIFFDEQLRFMGDQDFNIHCASVCDSFIVLKSPRYYYYRDNEYSVTAKQKDVGEFIVRCVNSVYSYLSVCGVSTIDDYFYNDFMPEKVKAYVVNKLSNKSFSNNLSLLDNRINLKRVPLSVSVRIGLYSFQLLSKLVCRCKKL